MVKIQCHTSEYQLGENFNTLVYDIHTGHWWSYDKEIISVVIPDNVYYTPTTEKNE